MSETIMGPLCPCGHRAYGHFLSGCLAAQWFNETSNELCPCDRNEDEALAVATSPAQGEA